MEGIINKTYHGDCIEIMDMLIAKGITVDAIITDPPYGTTSCSWDSVIPFDTMRERLNRIIKPNGAIVLFGSEPFSLYLRISNIANFRYDWIWHKNSSGGFVLAKKQPMKYHEIISVFYKKQPTYNPQFEEYSESTKKRFNDGDYSNIKKQIENPTNQIHGNIKMVDHKVEIKRGCYPKSVQKIKGVPTANSIRVHPTQKPIELMEFLVNTYTNEGDLVLDFTMGSGTTCVASKKLKRKFIGIEIEKKYFDIANNRLKNIQRGLF